MQPDENSERQIRIVMIGEPLRIILGKGPSTISESVVEWLTAEKSFVLVGVVETGEAGLAKAIEFQPDIAIIDRNLPDMGADELTRMMKDAVPQTRIIIAMVTYPIEYLNRLLAAGATQFLAVPVEREELIQTIRDVFSKKSRQQ